MVNLFSYGTLQQDQVQLETFGRYLTGNKDTLPCYALSQIEIKDAEVIRKSNKRFHPIVEYTGNSADKVDGTLFEITDEELVQADSYEVDDYVRIYETFSSGKSGYVYVRRKDNGVLSKK